MSDEVDTNWDNDITVRLELTRRNLKVISNKLSNSYSLPHCEYFHGENYFPCALFCVQCRWNSLGSNFVYVGFCPATLCVLMGKYPTVKTLTPTMFARWRSNSTQVSTLVEHLQRNMSFEIYPMNVRLKISKQKNPNKKRLLPKVKFLWSSTSLL